jgi:peptide/nickel transport system permease protein
MLRYLARRISQAVAVLLLVTLIAFMLIHLLPGSPARALLGPRATPEEVAAFTRANGYNHSVFVQYWDYLKQLLHGNLGYSYHANQSVGSLIAQDLPKTLLLVWLAFMIGIAIAVPIGLLQAAWVGGRFDRVVTSITFVLYAMPSFWLAFLLIYAFAIQLKWLPFEAPQGSGVSDMLRHPAGLLLPALVLGLGIMAGFVRYVRSSALDSLVQDYIIACRAKGMSETRLIFRHVLRNSLVPVLTLLGASIPYALSGTVIIESVFNFPGMGLLFWTSAGTRDYAVMIGCTLIVGIGAVLGSLIVDILYTVLDPRVRTA